MEFEGFNQEGKKVKADYLELAKDNAMEGESFAGVGSSPVHARYRSEVNGKVNYRDVDLREVAAQAGIRDVTFKLDYKKAKEQGLFHDADVDSGVAYNLERIRSDEGRRAYLKNKGHTGIYNEGDNYYSCENGYIKALNNKDDEMDWTDIARLAGKAGRDIGSMVGVGAATTAAPLSGGASLLAAGAAGAAGGAIGELAQRGFDIAVGAEASKYNAKLSGSEEATALAKDVGVGAISGVAGRATEMVMGKAVQAVKGVVSAQAAKQEASYLSGQIPSVASKGEASAQAMLKGSLRVEKDIANTKVEQGVVSGRLKTQAVEDGEQTVLREASKTKKAQDELVNQQRKQADDLFKKTKAERIEIQKKKAMARAEETFGKSHGEKVEKIFNATTDLNEANTLANEIEKDFISSIQKATKVNLTKTPDGRIAVDDTSLRKFTTKMLTDQADEVGSYADQMAEQGFSFKAMPDIREKAAFSDSLNSAMTHLDTLAKNEQIGKKDYDFARGLLSRTVKAVDAHSELNHADTSWALAKFMKESREIVKNDNLPDSVHNALRDITDKMFNYAKDSSDIPIALDQAYAAQSKVLAVKALERKMFTMDLDDPSILFNHFAEMTKVGGDVSGNASSWVVSMQYLKAKESGDTELAKKLYKVMSDVHRTQFSAFDAVRNHQTIVEKKLVPKVKPEAEEGFIAKALPGVVGGGVTMTLTPALGFPAAATIGTAAAGLVSKTGRQAAAKALKGGAAAAVAAAKNKGVQAAVRTRAATGAEEYMADKLQNFTKSGHNRKD